MEELEINNLKELENCIKQFDTYANHFQPEDEEAEQEREEKVEESLNKIGSLCDEIIGSGKADAMHAAHCKLNNLRNQLSGFGVNFLDDISDLDDNLCAFLLSVPGFFRIDEEKIEEEEEEHEEPNEPSQEEDTQDNNNNFEEFSDYSDADEDMKSQKPKKPLQKVKDQNNHPQVQTQSNRQNDVIDFI